MFYEPASSYEKVCDSFSNIPHLRICFVKAAKLFSLDRVTFLIVSTFVHLKQ
jgi:hypothetical protein